MKEWAEAFEWDSLPMVVIVDPNNEATLMGLAVEGNPMKALPMILGKFLNDKDATQISVIFEGYERQGKTEEEIETSEKREVRFVVSFDSHDTRNSHFYRDTNDWVDLPVFEQHMGGRLGALIQMIQPLMKEEAIHGNTGPDQPRLHDREGGCEQADHPSPEA